MTVTLAIQVAAQIGGAARRVGKRQLLRNVVAKNLGTVLYRRVLRALLAGMSAQR